MEKEYTARRKYLRSHLHLYTPVPPRLQNSYTGIVSVSGPIVCTFEARSNDNGVEQQERSELET